VFFVSRVDSFREKPDLENEAKWTDFAKTVSLEYKRDGMYLDGSCVEAYLRSDAVESVVAALSAILPIRHLFNKKKRAEGWREPLNPSVPIRPIWK